MSSIAATLERGKLPPKIAVALTTSRSSVVSESSRAESSELRLAGTSSSPISLTASRWPSRSARSTAIGEVANRLDPRSSGIPSACETIRLSAGPGSPGTESPEQLADHDVGERIELHHRRSA